MNSPQRVRQHTIRISGTEIPHFAGSANAVIASEIAGSAATMSPAAHTTTYCFPPLLDAPQLPARFAVEGAKAIVVSRADEDQIARRSNRTAPVLRYVLSLRISAPDAGEIEWLEPIMGA